MSSDPSVEFSADSQGDDGKTPASTPKATTRPVPDLPPTPAPGPGRKHFWVLSSDSDDEPAPPPRPTVVIQSDTVFDAERIGPGATVIGDDNVFIGLVDLVVRGEGCTFIDCKRVTVDSDDYVANEGCESIVCQRRVQPTPPPATATTRNPEHRSRRRLDFEAVQPVRKPRVPSKGKGKEKEKSDRYPDEWRDGPEPLPKAGDRACVICMERACTTVVVPCGHSCACVSCIRLGKPTKCPLCNKPLEKVIRRYDV